MDLPFLLTKNMYVWIKENLFQSLFLWIFRSYIRRTVDSAYSSYPVSILVLMDLPFLLIKIEDIMLDMELFQSLFLWIFRSYD